MNDISNETPQQQIENLLKEVEKLERALQPFAQAADEIGKYPSGAICWEHDGGGFDCFEAISTGDLIRAKEALNKNKGEK